jgi:hypothetical protein
LNAIGGMAPATSGFEGEQVLDLSVVVSQLPKPPQFLPDP